MSTIASTILTHKFLLAIALASLTVTGGAVAVGASENTLGTMSFTVNSSINVVSIANMDFGNLSSGQSGTFTSNAKVNMASSGNYTLFLENDELLENVFSTFTVNVTGLASGPIILSLDHTWARFSATSGSHSVTIKVTLSVSDEIGRTITVSSVPFLAIGTYPGHIEPLPPASPLPNHDDNGPDDDIN